MSVNPPNKSTVTVCIRQNGKDSGKNRYYLVNSCNGIVLFYIPVYMEKLQKEFRICTDKFDVGINQLTFVDEQMRPIAERLIFVKKDDFLDIDIRTDKKEYGKREKVNVSINTKFGSDTVLANLSVSIVNQGQVIAIEKYPQNILSYLLLSSELKGNVENSAYYFSNDSTSTIDNLDLLMLSQGWRTYIWDNFQDNLPLTEYPKERGLVVNGSVKRLLSKKGADKGKVTMMMKTKDGKLYIDETICDSLGNFKFPPMIFPDSSSVFMQGLNKNKFSNTEILDIKSFLPTAPVNIGKISFLAPGELDVSEFNKMAYERHADDKLFHPDKYNILLDEIVITKNVDPKKQQDDGHFRMYSNADYVLEIKDDASGYSDIWHFIAGRVPGLYIAGDNITIRGASSFNGDTAPYFLLDGIPVDKETLDGIPTVQIEKIEVLKDISNLAVFGSQGANGVLAVYTKQGSSVYQSGNYHGIISNKIRGFYQARKFYSPNYEVKCESKPDHRATLFWNPNLTTKSSGQANFSFFTSDDQAPVIIKVEGLSYTGKPGVAFLKLYMNGK